AQGFERAFDRLCVTFKAGFTPTYDSVLCFHPYKEPARRDPEGLDFGDGIHACRASPRVDWWRVLLTALEMERPVPASNRFIASRACAASRLRIASSTAPCSLRESKGFAEVFAEWNSNVSRAARMSEPSGCMKGFPVASRMASWKARSAPVQAA